MHCDCSRLPFLPTLTGCYIPRPLKMESELRAWEARQSMGSAARSEKILMSGFSGAHILAVVTELKVFQRKPNHRPQGGSTQQYFPGLKLAGAP